MEAEISYITRKLKDENIKNHEKDLLKKINLENKNKLNNAIKRKSAIEDSIKYIGEQEYIATKIESKQITPFEKSLLESISSNINTYLLQLQLDIKQLSSYQKIKEEKLWLFILKKKDIVLVA